MRPARIGSTMKRQLRDPADHSGYRSTQETYLKEQVMESPSRPEKDPKAGQQPGRDNPDRKQQDPDRKKQAPGQGQDPNRRPGQGQDPDKRPGNPDRGDRDRQRDDDKGGRDRQR